MRRCEGPILVIVTAVALLASSSNACAQPVTGYGPIPTLENLQTGLLDMLRHLNLTHMQHEQVERIIASETMQFAIARGNPNLSVAKIFAQEQAIRIQARRQIESILTPRQKEIIAKHIIHEMEEDERWGEDRTDFFSIPAIY